VVVTKVEHFRALVIIFGSGKHSTSLQPSKTLLPPLHCVSRFDLFLIEARPYRWRDEAPISRDSRSANVIVVASSQYGPLI